jgi:hypothetical protein
MHVLQKAHPLHAVFLRAYSPYCLSREKLLRPMNPGDRSTTKQQAQLSQQCVAHPQVVEGRKGAFDGAAMAPGRGDESLGAGNGVAGANNGDWETTASPFSWAAAAAASRLNSGAKSRLSAACAPRPQAANQLDANGGEPRRGSVFHNV